MLIRFSVLYLDTDLLPTMKANFYILSEVNDQTNHVGYSPIRTLCRVLSELPNTIFLHPKKSNEKGKVWLASKFSMLHNRVFRSWFFLEDIPNLYSEINILLVIGLNPHFLLSKYSLGPLLKKMDLQIGYILDGFPFPEMDSMALQGLDHLFIICGDQERYINEKISCDCHFLPLAIDLLENPVDSKGSNRFIDIISYGRSNLLLHQQLQYNIGRNDSKYFYFHSTAKDGFVLDLGEHLTLMSKLRKHSKISICFEASNIPRFSGFSPILYRWFEAWSSGCSVVGKRPYGLGVEKLLDWEDSVIDLPERESEWMEFIYSFLSDETRLIKISRRNYKEALLRHDWIYRIRDVLNTIELQLPEEISNRSCVLRDMSEEYFLSD